MNGGILLLLGLGLLMIIGMMLTIKEEVIDPIQLNNMDRKNKEKTKDYCKNTGNNETVYTIKTHENTGVTSIVEWTYNPVKEEYMSGEWRNPEFSPIETLKKNTDGLYQEKSEAITWMRTNAEEVANRRLKATQKELQLSIKEVMNKLQKLATRRYKAMNKFKPYDEVFPLASNHKQPDGKEHTVYHIRVGGMDYVGYTSQKFEKRLLQHLIGIDTRVQKELTRQNYQFITIAIETFDNQIDALIRERAKIANLPSDRLNDTPGGEAGHFNLFTSLEDGILVDRLNLKLHDHKHSYIKSSFPNYKNVEKHTYEAFVKEETDIDFINKERKRLLLELKTYQDKLAA